MCRTTPAYIEIASGGNGSSTVELTARASTTLARPMVELWVHESLFGEGNTAVLDLLGAQLKASDLVKFVSAAFEIVGGSPESVTQLQSVVDQHPIHTDTLGKWRVLDWGRPLPNFPALANVPVPPQTLSASSPPNSNLRSAAGAESSNPSARYRIWKSGTFSANAAFISLDGDIVRLRRTTGVRTSIPLAKLSTADQQWVLKRQQQ